MKLIDLTSEKIIDVTYKQLSFVVNWIWFDICDVIFLCSQIPNPCSGNAQCINQQGYFECVCPAGYKLGVSQHDCVDIDECYERVGICSNGACSNLQGGFQCICHSGFSLTRDRDNCVDIDECQRNPNICNNGTCINILGSYKCQCYQGFKLSPNNDCAGEWVTWFFN